MDRQQKSIFASGHAKRSKVAFSLSSQFMARSNVGEGIARWRHGVAVLGRSGVGLGVALRQRGAGGGSATAVWGRGWLGSGAGWRCSVAVALEVAVLDSGSGAHLTQKQR
uniref:Uncharacterized protein n=1 Tax=Oryza nivara TaxID=4536 RepID=A0A0E0GYD5_ORYNI